MTTVCQDDDDEELLDESTRLNSTLEFKLDCVSVSEIHSRPVTIGLNDTAGCFATFCTMLPLSAIKVELNEENTFAKRHKT